MHSAHAEQIFVYSLDNDGVASPLLLMINFAPVKLHCFESAAAAIDDKPKRAASGRKIDRDRMFFVVGGGAGVLSVV